MASLGVTITRVFTDLVSSINPSFDKNYPFCMACQNGDYEAVKTLLANPQVDPVALDNEAFLSACASKNLDVIQFLLADPRVDPGARNNMALRNACKYADDDIVELLLSHPQVDPSAKDDEAIQNACRLFEDYHDLIIDPKSIVDRLKIVTLLLSDDRVDPSANDNEAFKRACSSGLNKVVKLLLSHPKVDPTATDSEVIRTASLHGNVKIIKLLLKDGRADPSAKNNQGLRNACCKGHLEVVKLLLLDPRVDPSAMANELLRNFSFRPSPFSITRFRIAKLLLSDPRVDPEKVPEFTENLKNLIAEEDPENLDGARHNLTATLLCNIKVAPSSVNDIPENSGLLLKALLGFVQVSKDFDTIDLKQLKETNLDTLSPWDLDIIAFRNQHKPEIAAYICREQLNRLYIPRHLNGTPLLAYFLSIIGAHSPVQFEEIQRRVILISSIAKAPFKFTGMVELDALFLYAWTSLPTQ